MVYVIVEGFVEIGLYYVFGCLYGYWCVVGDFFCYFVCCGGKFFGGYDVIYEFLFDGFFGF